MKLLITFGTRPEAIKMAPVILAARSNPRYHTRICVTAQHRELLDQVLAFFSIVPDYDLDLMADNQHLSSLSAKILAGFKDVLQQERPDLVLVQGDTVSTFIASLAAFYERIPVAHVEAGLRTYELSAPFPEECMRQLVSRLAKLHFAPTEKNRDFLLAEGVSPECIFVTGNTVVDALHWTRNKLAELPSSYFTSLWGRARTAIESSDRLILVTGHRRESFGDGLRNICMALRRIAQRHPDVHILYPVHPNPNVSSLVEELLDNWGNIYLLQPLDYCSFVYLMNRSYMIITDSGGIQEEAPALNKPVLVTRFVTERQEGLDSGVARLVGTDQEKIVEEAELLLNSSSYYAKFAHRKNPYGSGNAAIQIMSILDAWLCNPTHLSAPSELSRPHGWA